MIMKKVPAVILKISVTGMRETVLAMAFPTIQERKLPWVVHSMRVEMVKALPKNPNQFGQSTSMERKGKVVQYLGSNLEPLPVR